MVANSLARCVTGTLALASIVALQACATFDGDRARNELADAERAFARDGRMHGIRASFIEHFAPDGIVFEPEPVRVREVWPTRPAAVDPLAMQLAWRPVLVDVARAGDLGYSTGPYTLTDATGQRPPSRGTFFSVWQRQPDGAWKVWLDIGGRTTAAVDDAAFTPRPRVPDGPQPVMHATASTITDLDRALSGIDAAKLGERLARDARRHEDGHPPIPASAWQEALSRDGAQDYEPTEARVSASGDFAASYGRVTRRAATGARSGHYCHVWIRDGGAWWLAAEALVFER